MKVGMKKMEIKHLETYIHTIADEIDRFLSQINKEDLVLACEMISNCKENHGRVHVTGVGKPSHVAQYIAALNSSIGTPTYYLDTTEAVHGSAGQVLPFDTLIAISNSGETEELKRTILAIKRLGATVIGVSGNPSSWLSQETDLFLFAGILNEGDELNKPPRASVLAEMILLQCLSILLQQQNKLDLSSYYQWHPGGQLGQSIRKGR